MPSTVANDIPDLEVVTTDDLSPEMISAAKRYAITFGSSLAVALTLLYLKGKIDDIDAAVKDTFFFGRGDGSF